jgi:hypothetical protein
MTLTGLVAANNLGDVVDIEKTWDNIGNSISATVFVPSPTLDLNFASNKSLIDNVSGSGLVTFTRPSTGTFIGSNGLIQTAASGVPRFEHNGATGESLGLLVEEARTNSCIRSETFTGSPFTLEAATATKDQVDPTGSSNATKITLSAGTASHRIYETISFARVCRSFYVKKTNCRYVYILDNNGGYYGPAYQIDFDLAKITVIVQGQYTPNIGTDIFNVGNGFYRVWFDTAQINMWAMYPSNTNYPVGSGLPVTFAANGTESFIIWGYQVETGAFPTSYIPTSGSTATRVADTVSIAGANFSSWYRNASSTFALRGRFISRPINYNTWGILSVTAGSADNNHRMRIGSNSGTQFSAKRFDNGASYEFNLPGSVTAGSTYNYAVGYDDTGHAASSPLGFSSITYPALPYQGATSLTFVPEAYGASHTVARLTYYPIRLSNITLQALTTYGPVSSFPYSFSIKGRDILALKEVNKTSTRDFIFTKGLLSKAQPRLTTASQYTSSGVALRDAAMPKFAPVTAGNYSFSSGLTLSGTTVQINGTNALSIATSPFTGSGATVPLLFAGLRPQANWRISETMASGVVASPESAIPIETSDFLLFMKAGQS